MNILFFYLKFFILGLNFFMLSGCTIGFLNKSIKPVSWENITLGQSRSEVRDLLKKRPDNIDSFIKTEKLDEELSFDYYYFVDVSNKKIKHENKSLYFKNDILAGLEKYLLYPFAQNKPKKQVYLAKACFDSKDKLVYYLISKGNGEVLKEAGTIQLKEDEKQRTFDQCTPDDPWCCNEKNTHRPDWCHSLSHIPSSYNNEVNHNECDENNRNRPSWCETNEISHATKEETLSQKPKKFTNPNQKSNTKSKNKQKSNTKAKPKQKSNKKVELNEKYKSNNKMVPTPKIKAKSEMKSIEEYIQSKKRWNKHN